jgi:hypothetical protein
MPLLPRSRRGTGLLAGAVWLAACAGLWWAVPVVPRAVMRLPEDMALIGLGPTCTTGLALHARSASNLGQSQDSIELIEVPSGRRLATLCNVISQLQIMGSSDRQTWVLFEKDAKDAVCHLLKLKEVAADKFQWSDLPANINRAYPLCLSSDGRFCAMDSESESNGKGVVIWDLNNNCLHGTQLGIRWPVAFSADSRSIAGSTVRNPTLFAYLISNL